MDVTMHGRRARRTATRIGTRLRDDRGTAAVSFLLCLPIFLTIVAVIVQFALIVNAKIMVTNAAAAAARSAMTSLPEDVETNVKRAAVFSLAPVSPKAKIGKSADALAVTEALQVLGTGTTDDFADRYTYAEDAVTVSYPKMQYHEKHGQDIEVTVAYKFYLTVPIWQAAFGQKGSVAGVTGNFWTVTSTVRVQTAHGRAAGADGSGWAQ